MAEVDILKLFREIQTIFQTSRNLSNVFTLVYEVIQNFLGDAKSIRVSLLLYDELQGGLISEQYFGLYRFGTKGVAQPIGYSISGKCFLEGKPVYINDCMNTDLIPQEYVIELNLKSVVALPILFQKKPIGVLRIDNLKSINAFNNSDIELFSIIAEQIGIVIENARLIERQAQTLESIEAIDKIYRDTIANSNGVAYSFNFQNKKYNFIGEGCQRLFEIFKEEIPFERIDKRIVVDPLGPEDFNEYFHLFCEGLRDRYQIHFRIRTSGGKKKWVSDFALPIKDEESGTIVGYQGIMYDITQQKRNEDINKVLLQISTAVHSTPSLEELFPQIHQALSKIIETRNFYIALIDSKNQNIVFPYAHDEVDTPPWEPIQLSDLQSLTAELINNHQVLLLGENDLDFRYHSGKSIIRGFRPKCWLGATLFLKGKPIGAIAVQSYSDSECYQEEDKWLLLSVAEQIAISVERKQTYDEIKRKNEELLKINAEKDKFFSIIAHDLKSPFQGFLGLTEFLAEGIEAFSPEELTKLSKEMYKSADNLFKLLDNLLTWTQIKKDTINFIPQEINLRALAAQNVDTIYQRALQKKVTIINKIPESIFIKADENMVNAIFRNLLSNAVKFTNEGSVSISSREPENNMIEIVVKDNGIGIPPNLCNKLFMIEEKVGRMGTDGEKSTGLGLLLCKEFIEKHNGGIWVESFENVGSSFHFTLPVLIQNPMHF